MEPDLLGKKFAEYLKNSSYPESTRRGYQVDIKQFVTFLQDKRLRKLNELKPHHLINFLLQLQAKGYAPRSISHKINALKIFYRFLVQKKLAPNNLAQGLKHPKTKIKEPRILSKEEYHSLRIAAQGDLCYIAMIETLLQTGLRISELANLKLKDVTLVSGPKFGHIRVPERKGERTIPINNAMEKTLAEYLAKRPRGKSEHVFLTKTGRPIPVRNIRRRLGKFFKKAGLSRVMVNDLRNTFIAHQLIKELSVERVAYLVGYKNLSSLNKFMSALKDQIMVAQEETIEEL